MLPILTKKLEEKLFDNHMQTMFDLVDELMERDELTDVEESFMDAFMEWNDFLCGDEENIENDNNDEDN